MNEIPLIEDIYSQTLKLISLYHLHKLPIPFGLKGNLGEFHVQMELMKRFKDVVPKFLGGSYPGIDNQFGKVGIQVKTQVKSSRMEFKKGSFDFESSPTIKRSTFETDTVDILVLVILYPDENYVSINCTNVYIFDRDDFDMFRTEFCWSGKSKGDRTIVKIIRLEGIIPIKRMESIAVYNTSEYEKLFASSKDNWTKIENAWHKKKILP